MLDRNVLDGNLTFDGTGNLKYNQLEAGGSAEILLDRLGVHWGACCS